MLFIAVLEDIILLINCDDFDAAIYITMRGNAAANTSVLAHRPGVRADRSGAASGHFNHRYI